MAADKIMKSKLKPRSMKIVANKVQKSKLCECNTILHTWECNGGVKKALSIPTITPFP